MANTAYRSDKYSCVRLHEWEAAPVMPEIRIRPRLL